MPFFVKAACLALEQYPVVNAQIEGDSIVYKHYVNMGIAVASEQGLVVPVIEMPTPRACSPSAGDLGAGGARARRQARPRRSHRRNVHDHQRRRLRLARLDADPATIRRSAFLGLHKIQERPIAVDGRS